MHCPPTNEGTQVTREEIERAHKEWTRPGSFYEKAGGRFKGMNPMKIEDELKFIEQRLSE